jgi:hypothetical protein
MISPAGGYNKSIADGGEGVNVNVNNIEIVGS